MVSEPELNVLVVDAKNVVDGELEDLADRLGMEQHEDDREPFPQPKPLVGEHAMGQPEPVALDDRCRPPDVLMRNRERAHPP